MAGQTDNTDILAGINQLIQAVNDKIMSCTPSVSSNVTVYCGQGGAGKDPPSEPAEEGQPPPDGWEDPPTPGYNRKCRVANAIHENFRQYVYYAERNGIDTIYEEVVEALWDIVVALSAAIIAEMAPVLGVPLLPAAIGSAVGFPEEIALALWTGDFDMARLLSVMDANEEALVCALYNSVDYAQAVDDYQQILLDNGATAGDVALLDKLMIADIINFLFFQRGALWVAKGGPDVEAALDGYVGSVDCSGCGGPVVLYMIWGSLVSSDNNTFILQSEQAPGGNHQISFHVNDPDWDDATTPVARMTAATTPGYVGPGYNNWAQWQFYRLVDAVWTLVVESNAAYPPMPSELFRQFNYVPNVSSQFQITITLENNPGA